MRNFLVSSLILGSSLVALNANAAGTDSTTFQVKITVNESCKFTNKQDVNFDAIDRSTGKLNTATGQLDITCTLGTPYQIALEGNGKMSNTSKSGSTIAYNLFQDAQYQQAWDKTNKRDDVGTGNSQALTVYAKLTGENNVEAGDYLDTVVATVTY